MTDQEKYEMGQRLKKEIKSKFGTIEKLNELLGQTNLASYTSKKPREPRAGMLAKFAEVGINTEYVLLGDTKSVDKGIKIDGNNSGQVTNIDNKNWNGEGEMVGRDQVHNGDSYSSSIIDTLRDVINSQQQIITQLSNNLTEITTTVKHTNMLVKQHYDEGHDYMNDGRKEFVKIDKCLESNIKQATLMKNIGANKDSWTKHVEEAEKYQKEIKDKLDKIIAKKK